MLGHRQQLLFVAWSIQDHNELDYALPVNEHCVCLLGQWTVQLPKKFENSIFLRIFQNPVSLLEFLGMDFG